MCKIQSIHVLIVGPYSICPASVLYVAVQDANKTIFSVRAALSPWGKLTMITRLLFLYRFFVEKCREGKPNLAPYSHFQEENHA